MTIEETLEFLPVDWKYIDGEYRAFLPDGHDVTELFKKEHGRVLFQRKQEELELMRKLQSAKIVIQPDRPYDSWKAGKVADSLPTQALDRITHKKAEGE